MAGVKNFLPGDYNTGFNIGMEAGMLKTNNINFYVIERRGRPRQGDLVRGNGGKIITAATDFDMDMDIYRPKTREEMEAESGNQVGQ